MPAEPLKVLVKSPFSGYSGYGNDGFGLLRALHQWGCDAYPQPTHVDVPIPADLLPLFGKTLRTPFDLVINHWAPGYLELTREARQGCRVAVAWTMWEFSGPSQDAIRPCREHRKELGVKAMGLKECPHCHPPVSSGFTGFEFSKAAMSSTLRKRLRWYDMVLGYDEVSAAALAPYTPRQVSLGVLQGGYDSSDWKPAGRDWFDPNFGFMMHGQLGSRKQPWVAIEAFQKLKYEKPGSYPGGFDEARLSLHTSAPGHIFPELNVPFEKSRIRVYIDSFDREMLQDFYAAHHVLLAPSRGEGKNLPALEAATTGAVPCVSRYGGHMQWAGEDWAYLLDGTLEPTFGSKPWGARDFRVSVDSMAAMLWHIWTHREEARGRAERAAELVPKMCDWQVVVESLFRRIRDSVTSRGIGQQVYDKAMWSKREERRPGAQPVVNAGTPWP